MPRTREFEPEEALHKAMYLFWQKGYQETSMADLVQTTGVSRYGLYTTFGDKHDLFLKAVARYATTAIHRLLAPLETPHASVREIHAYFDSLLASVETPQLPAGCLIGNTALEFTEEDAAVQGHIDNHFARMGHAFQNALDNSVQQGDLPATLDVPATADYLVGIALGFLAYIRTQPTPKQLQNFIHHALQGLG